MQPAFRVQQIDHVELFVPDFEAALEWYRDVLGLEPVEKARAWAEAGEPHMISSDGGSTMLALFHGEGPGNRDIVGHNRVAFRVDAAGFMKWVCAELPAVTSGKDPLYWRFNTIESPSEPARAIAWGRDGESTDNCPIGFRTQDLYFMDLDRRW